MIFDNVVPLQKGIDGKIYIDHYSAIIFYDEMGKNKYASVRMKRPTRKQSEEQRKAFHGWVRDLLIQYKCDGVDFDFDDLKEKLKMYAVSMYDYPCYTSFDGKCISPKSTGKLSKDEYIKLQNAVVELAKTRNYWLTMKDDIGKYKSLYGSSREYMKENYPELNN